MNTYYAIINVCSESVRYNLPAIKNRLSRLKSDKGIVINSLLDNDSLFLTENISWESVNAQYEIAKKYTHIIVFGGDGTKTYILNRLITDKSKSNFIGVSVGTMNIGKYYCDLNSLADVIICGKKKNLDAICVDIDKERSYCFIDSVITTTCVSRLYGKVAQVSARELLNGNMIYAKPGLIGNKSTNITIDTLGNEKKVACFSRIKTIAFSFFLPSLKGNILTGGADPCSCAQFEWGLIISSFPLIWADATQSDIIKRSPIISSIYPLLPSSNVKIENLLSGAYLINDGNAVLPVNSCNVTYKKDVYSIICMR